MCQRPGSRAAGSSGSTSVIFQPRQTRCVLLAAHGVWLHHGYCKTTTRHLARLPARPFSIERDWRADNLDAPRRRAARELLGVGIGGSRRRLARFDGDAAELLEEAVHARRGERG